MKIDNNLNFSKNQNYLERYSEAILTSFHNHLRISRILSHMNVVGFRELAIKFVDFLDKEVSHNSNAPLKMLNSLKYNPLLEWKKYGQ